MRDAGLLISNSLHEKGNFFGHGIPSFPAKFPERNFRLTGRKSSAQKVICDTSQSDQRHIQFPFIRVSYF